MLKDIKLGFKMLKYAYNFKVNVIFSIFFLIISVFTLLLGIDSFLFGGIYGYIGLSMVIQMNYSLLFAQMVPVTSKRKLFELTLPNVLFLLGSSIWYMILCIFTYSISGLHSEQQGEYYTALVLVSIFMLIISIYYGICYKYFVVGTILFSITFMICYFLGREGIERFLVMNRNISFEAAAVAGFLIMITGCVISGILRKLFYKKPISPLSMGTNLRKAMG